MQDGIRGMLPRGTPEQVQAAVKHNIAILGKGGGYILAPGHAIQNDSRVENILAMYDVSLRCFP